MAARPLFNGSFSPHKAGEAEATRQRLAEPASERQTRREGGGGRKRRCRGGGKGSRRVRAPAAYSLPVPARRLLSRESLRRPPPPPPPPSSTDGCCLLALWLRRKDTLRSLFQGGAGALQQKQHRPVATLKGDQVPLDRHFPWTVVHFPNCRGLFRTSDAFVY